MPCSPDYTRKPDAAVRGVKNESATALLSRILPGRRVVETTTELQLKDTEQRRQISMRCNG